jgi:hypothetical protein
MSYDPRKLLLVIQNAFNSPNLGNVAVSQCSTSKKNPGKDQIQNSTYDLYGMGTISLPW